MRMRAEEQKDGSVFFLDVCVDGSGIVGRSRRGHSSPHQQSTARALYGKLISCKTYISAYFTTWYPLFALGRDFPRPSSSELLCW